jgi:hypothetical protein
MAAKRASLPGATRFRGIAQTQRLPGLGDPAAIAPAGCPAAAWPLEGQSDPGKASVGSEKKQAAPQPQQNPVLLLQPGTPTADNLSSAAIVARPQVAL